MRCFSTIAPWRAAVVIADVYSGFGREQRVEQFGRALRGGDVQGRRAFGEGGGAVERAAGRVDEGVVALQAEEVGAGVSGDAVGGGGVGVLGLADGHGRLLSLGALRVRPFGTGRCWTPR